MTPNQRLAADVIYVECPAEYSGNTPSVFLAGGITDCPDWQTQARHFLRGHELAVLNPRRANFPIHDPAAAAAQIDWEYRHLSQATVTLFWFPASPSAQPIALYELGRQGALGKPIVVGADPAYLRRADVVLQLAHARPDVTVHDRLEATCAEAAGKAGGAS